MNLNLDLNRGTDVGQSTWSVGRSVGGPLGNLHFFRYSLPGAIARLMYYQQNSKAKVKSQTRKQSKAVLVVSCKAC